MSFGGEHSIGGMSFSGEDGIGDGKRVGGTECLGAKDDGYNSRLYSLLDNAREKWRA